MIQRKQTLFLLAAFILLTIQLFSPLSTIVYNTQGVGEMLSETIRLMPFRIDSALFGSLQNPISIYYGVILIVAALLALTAIFLFKNRPLQMRITLFSLFATMIVIGLECYYLYSVMDVIRSTSVESSNIYSIILPAPILDILLLFIAHRMILKDEVLIRSNERFR